MEHVTQSQRYRESLGHRLASSPLRERSDSEVRKTIDKYGEKIESGHYTNEDALVYQLHRWERVFRVICEVPIEEIERRLDIVEEQNG